jgi:tRNA dimethylallyltransferase
VNYLKWEITLEECISLVQQHNRNYAKRQYTWFRRYDEFINW